MPSADPGRDSEPIAERLRVATFNIQELSTAQLTAVDESGFGTDPQARAAAWIIQRLRPDVLVLQEVDHDYGAVEEGLDLNARRFARNYLSAGDEPIDYSYAFAAPNNTGILSGLDLDRDGRVATDAERGEQGHGNDAFGFGTYPGQYSMAVLSRLPIVEDGVRTFQTFLWKDLPGHHMPEGHFTEAARDVFRLSSKSHWDVPLRVGERTLHLFVSHPTPPVFDGPEDLNGRRNFDEIKFWVEYLDDGDELYDDDGRRGGYRSDDPFVIVGDLNARPDQDESMYDGVRAIDQLLGHPRVQETGALLISRGGLEHGAAAGKTEGPPAWPERSTAEFLDGARVDYLLPSAAVTVIDGGVFWPSESQDPEGHRMVEEASDHRLVWLDVALEH